MQISGCFSRLCLLFLMWVWKGDICSSNINDNTLRLGFAPHCTDGHDSLTLARERLNTSSPAWCNDWLQQTIEGKGGKHVGSRNAGLKLCSCQAMYSIALPNDYLGVLILKELMLKAVFTKPMPCHFLWFCNIDINVLYVYVFWMFIVSCIYILLPLPSRSWAYCLWGASEISGFMTIGTSNFRDPVTDKWAVELNIPSQRGGKDLCFGGASLTPE